MAEICNGFFKSLVYRNGNVLAQLEAMHGACWFNESRDRSGGFYYIPDPFKLAYFDPSEIDSISFHAANRVAKYETEDDSLARQIFRYLRICYPTFTGQEIELDKFYNRFIIFRHLVYPKSVFFLVEVTGYDPNYGFLPARIEFKDDKMWYVNCTAGSVRVLFRDDIKQVTAKLSNAHRL
jgi:hypothetical protein